MRLADWIQVTPGGTVVVGYDDRGNEVYGEPSSFWEPAQYTAVSSTEQIVGRDRVEAIYRIMLHPKTRATPETALHDRRGNAYEVRGDVEPQYDARGRVHHKVALAVRTTG